MAKKKLVNLSDVRRANCRLIFDTLYRNEGMTLLNLEHSTGLSRPTVVGMVRALEEAGLVKSVGKRESSGGRTPVLYGINPEACYAVGIDFEFPILRVAVSNLRGQIVESSKKELASGLPAEEAISSMIAQVNEVVEKTEIEREKILGIGLGMPGYINLKKGTSLRFERIADWKNIEIVKRISEGTGMPVFMENDVHLLYRAEQDLRKEKNTEDVLFIAIRSGIGSAIYQRGHIIEGEYGNAGHIGHTVIQVDGETCTCGNVGCLELYASERAIRQKYEKITGNRFDSVQEIANRAKEGETAAQKVLEEAGKYLGVGIGNAINMLDINKVIVSSFFDSSILLKSAQQMIDSVINIPQERQAKLYPSQLPETECALGGCRLVFHRNWENLMASVPLKNL